MVARDHQARLFGIHRRLEQLGQDRAQRLGRLTRADADHHHFVGRALLQPDRLLHCDIFTVDGSTSNPSARTRAFTVQSITCFTGIRIFMAQMSFTSLSAS